MVLKELIATLPNGLHDAQISKVELDYVLRKMRVHLDVLVGSPDAPTEPPSSVATVPENAFGVRVFVQQWNSFIKIAARDASLVWKD